MTTKEPTENQIEYQTSRLLLGLTDWGSADINTAIKTALEVDIDGSELADIVRSEAESMDTSLDKMDICYVIYEHILQMSRNKIDEVIKYDFLNDFRGDTEIYTYGNAMCTSYDYSQSAVDDLKEKLVEATQEDRDVLKDDDFVKFFLDALDLSWDEIDKEAKEQEQDNSTDEGPISESKA